MEQELLRLHETIKASVLNYHGCYWAECCFTFETRGKKLKFHRHGHPGGKMKWWPTISEANGLLDYEKFKAYLLNLLPRDSTGKIRVPKCNMKHGVPAPTSPRFRVEESEPEPEPAPVELPVDPVPSKLEALESTVMKITEEKESEKSLIETQRQTIEALQKEVRDLKLEKQNWERRLLALEGLAGSYKTNLEEVDRRALLALAKCKGSRMIDNAIIEELGHLKRDMRSRVEDLETAAEETKKLRDQENASLGKRNLYEPWESTKDVSEEPHPTPKLSGKELQKKIEKLAKKNEPLKKKSVFP